MSRKITDIIDQTIKAWQPYYEKELTSEDAREIVTNVSDFFKILQRWKENEKLQDE